MVFFSEKMKSLRSRLKGVVKRVWPQREQIQAQPTPKLNTLTLGTPRIDIPQVSSHTADARPSRIPRRRNPRASSLRGRNADIPITNPVPVVQRPQLRRVAKRSDLRPGKYPQTPYQPRRRRPQVSSHSSLPVPGMLATPNLDDTKQLFSGVQPKDTAELLHFYMRTKEWFLLKRAEVNAAPEPTTEALQANQSFAKTPAAASFDEKAPTSPHDLPSPFSSLPALNIPRPVRPPLPTYADDVVESPRPYWPFLVRFREKCCSPPVQDFNDRKSWGLCKCTAVHFCNNCIDHSFRNLQVPTGFRLQSRPSRNSRRKRQRLVGPVLKAPAQDADERLCSDFSYLLGGNESCEACRQYINTETSSDADLDPIDSRIKDCEEFVGQRSDQAAMASSEGPSELQDDSVSMKDHSSYEICDEDIENAYYIISRIPWLEELLKSADDETIKTETAKLLKRADLVRQDIQKYQM
jgi:hypothetical protein